MKKLIPFQKDLNFDKKIYDLLRQKTILDLRNILNRQEVENIGFKYICIGKK